MTSKIVRSLSSEIAGVAFGVCAYLGIREFAGPEVAAVIGVSAFAVRLSWLHGHRTAAEANTKAIINWIQSYRTMWEQDYPQHAQALAIIKNKLHGMEHAQIELVESEAPDNVVRLGSVGPT